jgi:mRNA interferase RelE/StbE
MTYKVVIADKAKKNIKRLDKQTQTRIVKAIKKLAENPRPNGCKALQGEFKGLTRIRIGDYRIIYEIVDNMLIITVLTVAPRGGIYS